MTASDRRQRATKLLQSGGHPHMSLSGKMIALRIVIGLAASLLIALVIVDFAADGIKNMSTSSKTTITAR